jgi:lipopolysaccharide transport system ATP-binding protein
MERDTVIKATGLGKCYTVGHRGEAVGTLRDAIVRTVGGLARSTGDMLRGRPLIAGDEFEQFWALRDVEFEVRRGEVLGIIGRNGAGKSTLLKLLSRITEPSAGRIEIRGRVASLLEVGTGFHPELTGRENIYLNGAILGMTRAEIRRKFDEIVAFAGVEKFLDTPVKRFSSGMYVRLAFAVAAHLEPEILVIDEVLAVGDAEFQQKCLGKMQDVAGEGRTVLFVSHNLAAVRQLCGRGMVLDAGSTRVVGTCEEAIRAYTEQSKKLPGRFDREPISDYGIIISSVSVSDLNTSQSDKCLMLPITIEVLSPVDRMVCLDIRFKDELGNPFALATSGSLESKSSISLERGLNKVHALVDISGFSVGHYLISIDITVPWTEYIDRLHDVVKFEISPHNWVWSAMPLMVEYGLGRILLSSSYSVEKAL